MGIVIEEWRNLGGEMFVDVGRGFFGVRVMGKVWERRCI